MNDVAAWPAVKDTEGTDWLAVTAPFTASEKLLLAVALFASVTATVKVVDASVTVGVPEIAPVDEFIDRPAGSAGEML